MDVQRQGMSLSRPSTICNCPWSNRSPGNLVPVRAGTNYTQEFRRQAVDLYRSTPGATLRGIAADLGISRGTLQVWVHALDPDPSTPSSAPCLRPSAPAATPGTPSGAAGVGGRRAGRVAGAGGGVGDRERRAREQTKLATERDILRQAAKYFAGETHW